MTIEHPTHDLNDEPIFGVPEAAKAIDAVVNESKMISHSRAYWVGKRAFKTLQAAQAYLLEKQLGELTEKMTHADKRICKDFVFNNQVMLRKILGK